MTLTLALLILWQPFHSAKELVSHCSPTIECVNLSSGGSYCRVTPHCQHRHEAKVPEGATIPMSGKHKPWSYTTAGHPTELILDGKPVNIKYVNEIAVSTHYKSLPESKIERPELLSFRSTQPPECSEATVACFLMLGPVASVGAAKQVIAVYRSGKKLPQDVILRQVKNASGQGYTIHFDPDKFTKMDKLREWIVLQYK